MEIASIPIARGMLASVEERSLRDLLPMTSSAARSAASSAASAGRSPPGRLPIKLSFHSSLPRLRSREIVHLVLDTDSHAFAQCVFHSDNFVFTLRTEIYLKLGFERNGIDGSAAFYLAKIKRGTRGSGNFGVDEAHRTANESVDRIGQPKSDQLWPPGPVMITSTRREARALVVTWSMPEPSRTITARNFRSPAIGINQGAHPAKVTFAFFADVCGEEDGPLWFNFRHV